MEWWREARFGLFIHWGLYAVPAGQWNGQTDHAEWIRTTAQIPVGQYEKFVDQFNPVKFNADQWVKYAKDAGMKYIVITSKHHDGFCMFDSKYTDFDIMSTPFKRDPLKELAAACKKEGIKLCFYHSIMDWHHPDYLPRRDWEKDRPADGADYNRYIKYMKGQLKELLTNYGKIGVLWFDGEWEQTWTPDKGRDLYNYVRSLQPDILVNNRVGAGRNGLEGFTENGEFGGDFGTPEQQIPATGLPNIDWETCMTMNDHWGYNSLDKNFKSSKDLLQMLVDIVSKGGNYLLNIGPTSEGLFPGESIERLREIGNWMHTNGESIYGTSASPFTKLDWGRCTKIETKNGTRLYLHVFNWPAGGKLTVPGIFNQPSVAFLLADANRNPLNIVRQYENLIITIPSTPPDKINSVVVLDLNGIADVNNPPLIESLNDIFLDKINVSVKSERTNAEIRYTLDGSEPGVNSQLVKGPVELTATSVVSAKCFRDGKQVSGTAHKLITKVEPRVSQKIENPKPGLKYKYFEGNWDIIPDFNSLKPVLEGESPNISLDVRKQNEFFGMTFDGYIKIEKTNVYTFSTDSDDGSRLYIDQQPVVDNDGLHGNQTERGVIALAEGYHFLRIDYFNKTGGMDLKVYIQSSGLKNQPVPDNLYFHR